MKMAILSDENPILSDENPILSEALRRLDAAETSSQVSAVLEWVDSASTEEE